MLVYITLDSHRKIWLFFICMLMQCICFENRSKKKQQHDCTLIQECYYRTWITCVEFWCNYKQIYSQIHMSTEWKKAKQNIPTGISNSEKIIVCVIAWKTLCKWVGSGLFQCKWMAQLLNDNGVKEKVKSLSSTMQRGKLSSTRNAFYLPMKFWDRMIVQFVCVNVSQCNNTFIMEIKITYSNLTFRRDTLTHKHMK